MQDKPMLILSIILTVLICMYFFFYGFSENDWTRWGQYGGLGMCVLIILDNWLRP